MSLPVEEFAFLFFFANDESCLISQMRRILRSCHTSRSCQFCILHNTSKIINVALFPEVWKTINTQAIMIINTQMSVQQEHLSIIPIIPIVSLSLVFCFHYCNQNNTNNKYVSLSNLYFHTVYLIKEQFLTSIQCCVSLLKAIEPIVNK